MIDRPSFFAELKRRVYKVAVAYAIVAWPLIQNILPVSKDAVDGPALITNLARVYALIGERDLALVASLAPKAEKWRK